MIIIFRLIKELNSTDPVDIHVQLSVTRTAVSKELSGTVVFEKKTEIENQVRQDLIDALEGSKENVTLKNILPLFLKATSKVLTNVPLLIEPLVSTYKKYIDNEILIFKL